MPTGRLGGRHGRLCKPAAIHWCDGSQAEYDRLCDQMVASGTLKRLNPAKRAPTAWLLTHRTWPAWKTAPTSAPKERKRRPHQQLDGTAEMRATLQPLFDGCMAGRTMYVVPFSMGPLGSPIAHIGIRLSDSPMWP